MNDLQARLTRCFAAVFPNLKDQQIATAGLDTVEGWDSVAAATLVTTIEEEFGIELDGEALNNLTSYRAIFDYLSALPPGE